jgi:hypothetical protein
MPIMRPLNALFAGPNSSSEATEIDIVAASAGKNRILKIQENNTTPSD